MAEFVKVATTGEIEDGAMKQVTVNGRLLAILNIDGEFFVVDDTCSHDKCSLSQEGFLEGNVIICGCHGAQFDGKTGAVQSLPATTDIGSYNVKTEGDDILVSIG